MPANSAFATDPRPLVALDWSFSGVHVTFDGRQVTRLGSVEELLDQLTEPHRIAAESTFESWDTARRQAMAAALRAEGHELYVYRPIHTARNRPEGMKKSDANDARVIHAIATAGRMHLYPLPAPDPAWEARRAELNREYQRIRLAGGKPELVAAAVTVLGRYKDLDKDARLVLGNGTRYSDSLLAAAYFATAHTTNRAEFERLLGLHASGYPTLLRSDVHHHSFRWARKRGVSWPMFRRQLRHVHRALRDHLGEGQPDVVAPLLDVTGVTVLARYLLELTFSTDEIRVVDVENLLVGPAFAALRADYSLFTAVAVDDEAGTLVWPNGADLAPEVLYARSKPAVPA